MTIKKIGIDARLYFQTGVGTYIQNLLSNLEKIVPKELIINVYVLPEDGKKIVFNNKQFVKRSAPYRWHSANEQVGFLDLLNKDHLDLVHFTYFSYPILYRRPFVTTIHDLTPLQFKTGKASTKNPLTYQLKHLVFRYVLRNQVFNARVIITPTQTVKRQLVDEFGRSYEDKIIVTYEGVSNSLMEAKENAHLKSKFPTPFYIYVGNFYPHKNVERLVNAFLKSRVDAQLILIGPDDYFAKRLSDTIGNDKIILYTTKNIGDLKFFYKNARALIHPSLSEGFGLPLVEAAYFDCPIIASDMPVFNELLGNQFVKFDQLNARDIAKKITAFDQAPIKFYYQKILKKFSFSEMTKKTLDVYKKNL